MSLTLLQLVDQVCGELSLEQPIAVIGSASNQVKQFLALVRRLGIDLVRQHEWQALVKQHVFQTQASISYLGTTVAGDDELTALTGISGIDTGDVVSGVGIPPNTELLGQTGGSSWNMNMPATASGTGVVLTFARQSYSLPSDYHRLIANTSWDRTNNWENPGPKSSQSWQFFKGGIVVGGPHIRFRLNANKIQIHPAPTTVTNLAYEYVSNQWVIGEGSGAIVGTTSTIAHDGDKFVFSDDLMQAGLKYYWLKAKKIDYSVEMAEFLEILQACKGQDIPVENQSMAPSAYDALAWTNVKEGSWEF